MGQAALYYVLLLICYVASLLDVVVTMTLPFGNLSSVLIYIPFIPLYMWLFRMWSRERLQLESRMANFGVEKSNCFCEADRPKVYNNIVTLMKAASAVPQ